VPAESRIVTLSGRAARRVSQLIAREGDAALMLRVSVEGGGCSGFRYQFGFDSMSTSEDRVFDYHGVRLVVDECSLDLIAGAEVDYVEDLAGAAFQVRNPNATASCGCGTSFAV